MLNESGYRKLLHIVHQWQKLNENFTLGNDTGHMVEDESLNWILHRPAYHSSQGLFLLWKKH